MCDLLCCAVALPELPDVEGGEGAGEGEDYSSKSPHLRT